MQYISVKKKMLHYNPVTFFQSHSFKDYKLDLVKKWAQVLSSFTHNLQLKSDSQTSQTNFIKLLMSDYTVYGICVRENFCQFSLIEYEIILKYRLKFVQYQIKDNSRNKAFPWGLNFIYWSRQLSSALYIIIINSFIFVVWADICNCSYLNR